MTEVRDDPRDVLALLNSLGFVGITAPQLKAFMKDLKMYRKIKERERQQWKEVTTKKILTKKESMLKEMLREMIVAKSSNSSENIAVSNNSSQQDEALVRIRVENYEDEDNEDVVNQINHNTQEPSKEPRIRETDKPDGKKNRGILSSILVNGASTRQRRGRSKSFDRSRLPEVSTESSQSVHVKEKNGRTQKLSQRQSRQIPAHTIPSRPLSAPVFPDEGTIIPEKRSKSVASDPTGIASTRNNPSRCSTHSQAKSFIRPWKLQPEAHRVGSARKSDPVALYQKYQQEWKQISFPGEDQHARLRWAIREKMLGADPNPRPILKKSQSLMSIKKR